MDNLRWWLLLIVAVLFSMSGCASSQDWAYWREHPTHFASGGHMTFSVKNDNPYYPMVTEADAKQAQAYGWWGDQVPLAPPTDLSGHWVGTWKGLGLFDSLREGDVEATLTQRDYIGVALLKMDNTIAADGYTAVDNPPIFSPGQAPLLLAPIAHKWSGGGCTPIGVCRGAQRRICAAAAGRTLRSPRQPIRVGARLATR